jgi:ferric-dicitrate binding protein FerR (iron transport regulator)
VALAQHLPAIPRPTEALADAVLRPSPGARFERMETIDGVERVHLEDGALDVEVRRLPPEERFLVTTADGEVEVRGTVFRVEALDGHLDRVFVTRGKVEVRHLGASTIVPAGGVWTRPQAAPPPRALPRVPAHPAERKAETSKAFAEGVALIERGDYATAADKLDAFRRANPGDARAEDAAYLTVLSLQRAGRPAAAAEAARRYLELYPSSARRGAVQKVLDNP